MNVYDTPCLYTKLENNPYPGRGIVCGKSKNGRYAVCAYFIMGRSENSRNRIFAKNGEIVLTKAFDESKVEDPSLIIYNAVRRYKNSLIVTNGDQTDTVFDFMAEGKSFEDALNTRKFEPDSPNFTPRISLIMNFANGDFDYKMSILKSSDENGTGCDRFYYSYTALPGVGHFIHTYITDGNPVIPVFVGEPERIMIPDSIDKYTDIIWDNLNNDNKISLYVRYTDLSDLSYEDRVVNKNK